MQVASYQLHAPLSPLRDGAGKLVGARNVTLLLEVCAPAIGDFELCLVTSSLVNCIKSQFLHSDREIVLRDIPRGGVLLDFHISQSLTPSRNGGSGHGAY